MTRKQLEKKYGQVWNTVGLTEEFEVISFLVPFVEVIRKSDMVEGLMEFQHMPRYYFKFVKTKE